MKKLKSLVLAFTLAAGGAIGLSSSANAQSLPVSVSPTQNGQTELVTNNYISDDVINAVGQLPLSNTYYRAGRGFTSARVNETGENVGVEYQLNGNQRQPVRAFNLDDAQGSADYRGAVMSASATENNLAQQELRTRVYSTYYPSYVYVAPIRPIILIGPLFRPFNNHYSYQHHEYNQRGWQQPPRYIAPPQINIRIGGGGGHDDHRNDRNDHRNDGGRGNDHRNDRGGPRHH